MPVPFVVTPATREVEMRGELLSAMKLSRLLCSSPEGEEEKETATAAPALSELADPREDQAPSSQISTESTVQRCLLVPDNERTRPHRLSATQRQQRREYQAYESRVYNLTLDINELRQQIQQLMECRDLYITRMLLNGERFEADVLQLVWNFLDGLHSGAFDLTPSARGFFNSRSHISQRDPGASGGVHQCVLQQGRSPFSNRTFVIKSIRVLAMVDNTTPGEAAREIRWVCGNGGGCVVEVLANVTGRITRDTLVALFPHIVSDEALASRMIGQQITFSSRLLLYFDSERRLTQQVAQADMVAALNALQLGQPSDFALLADVDDRNGD
ncbi:hypothetical protein PHYPSEUDO_005952 [Phytophthora pseudosyringae]|uniref:Bzip transcription factor n=1 Tax=Phytophthora pseudosyringae TaxID=221518 RepID=A0A8T1VQ38_9STRA|nr:hypothetical protein PHYPSEUDO_005952 [Phytophthora pseudosyringae]